ncbi:unnamed protein product [Bathycoccus prasinos]
MKRVLSSSFSSSSSSKSSFADCISLTSLRRTFLENVLGGKRNLKHISREIKRRKWIMESLRRSRLTKRKYLTDEDVLTVLLVTFAFALVLVLLLCVRVLVLFFKHRNVVLKEKEEETKETIKRDYSRSVTMHSEEEDSFTVDDFTPNEKRRKDRGQNTGDANATSEKSPLVKRVSIDETFGAETVTEKAKRTAIVAKEQPATASNVLSQHSLTTVEERLKIAELRQLVNDEKEELLSTDALKMYCSDAQLARNLRARKWDVLKAFEMLKKTLLWRKEYKPELIIFEDIEEELKTGKQYRSGRDRSGRRVIVMRPSRENTREHDGNIRLLVYTFENALWRTNGERIVRGSSNIPVLAQEQICVLINFTKWSLKLSPPWRTSMETLHIMQEHYPERLGLAVCYDPPSVFSVFWKLISPFIDVKTKSKIRFVQPRGDKQKAAKKMNATFHPNTIDSDMGGRVDATWDLDEYKVFLQRYDAVKKNVFETLKERRIE